MLQTLSLGITIVLFITTRVLIAEIEFIQTRNGKTVPIESSNDRENSLFLQNNIPLNTEGKIHTSNDTKPGQTISEKSVPGYSSKHELNSLFLRGIFPAKVRYIPNSNAQSATEKRKFSFLLDSNYKSTQMANKNVLQTTMDRQSSASDLITNNDIQLLQKFVKKLQSSVRTEEKVQTSKIPTQSSKLAHNIGSNHELRKTPKSQLVAHVDQQTKLQNAYENKNKYPSNQHKLFIDNANVAHTTERIVSLPHINNLSSMSKSDVDTLLSVVKEWKRLHAETKEKQQYVNQITKPNKTILQRIVNRYQWGKQIKQGSKMFGGRGAEKKVNPILDNMHGTGIKTGNVILNDAGKQLKETVDKAIANATQQLLQFIKLEKQLKGQQDGPSSNESKIDSHFLNTFVNLINTMRDSGDTKQAKDINTNSHSLRGHNEFKNKHNPKNNIDKQARLEKETSPKEKEGSRFIKTSKGEQGPTTNQKDVKEVTRERKQRQQTKNNQGKLQQRLKAKSQNKKSHKQKQTKQRKQKEVEKQQPSRQHNEEDGKKFKAKKQTASKDKDVSQKQGNDFKQHEVQEEQKQVEEEQEEQEKQQRHQQEQQEQQQGQEQQKQEQKEQKQQQQQDSAKITQNNQQTNVQNEYNTPQSGQQEIKEQTFQSPNTSTTDEQTDDVTKAARNYRLKTLKHLIASLAEDPFDTWIYHQKSFDELGITPSLLKAGIVNLGSSKPMQHAVRKAVKGENVKMLVVGGSISAGGGLWKDRGNIDGVYHRALAHWWKKTVTPVTKSDLEVNNVAIGGTDSEYFSYCINNFLDSDPDIVLWELSANDYNRFNERNFDPSKPLEQLTRIILQLPSHPALIYVNFFRGDKQNFELGEKCPDSEETEVDVLSRYYDIPSLSWRRMVCNLITKRTFVNQELFGDDGYHPNLLGHAQVAMLLMMYIKGVFESVLANDLGKMKTFNDLQEDVVDFQNLFQLKIPAFKDPLNPKPCCWTLVTPDYTKTFRSTLNDVNVLKGQGFELSNVTAWDVRTDRIQCLLARKPDAILDLSLNVPVLDDDRNLPLADAQTRTLAIATHNKFGGAAEVQLDELPSMTSVATETRKLKQTIVHIVSEDVRPGVHNLRFRSLSSGFCLTSIMVI